MPLIQQEVRIPVEEAVLAGDWVVPHGARGMVMFAHGSGSSRFSPRNQSVARRLQSVGLGTLLLDLLTPEEATMDEETRVWRFQVGLLASRLGVACHWLADQSASELLPIGLFGASTGAAAALVLAAQRPDMIHAVVSRGGRPDLAGVSLDRVLAPTLLIVGSRDVEVLALNRQALDHLQGPRRMAIIPGATHLFEEPGTLEQVASLASAWFLEHLANASRTNGHLGLKTDRPSSGRL